MAIQHDRIDGKMSMDALMARPLFHFDLEPVLERAGPTMLRNPNRLNIVCDHCVRSVSQYDDVIFSDTGFYLVVNSCEEPQATQLARQISIALLRCFFGEVEPPADLLQSLFRTPTEHELASIAARMPKAPGAAVASVEPASRIEPTTASGDPMVELAVRGIHSGEAFRFGFAPFFDLRRGTVSTFFCDTVRMHDNEIVHQRDSFASIGSRDLPRVDQAMLLQALAFSKRLKESGVVAAVGTNVSYETLAWSKGRQFYQNALRATNSADNAYLIVKIDMVPQGAPASRLQEMVAAIKPFARRVFLELPDGDFDPIQSAQLGAAGYVVFLRPGMAREEIAARAMRLARLCSMREALSCVERIPDLASADRVKAAGVRFGEGRFWGSKIYFDDTPLDAINVRHAETGDRAPAFSSAG